MAYTQIANIRLKDNVLINQKIDDQLSIGSYNPVANKTITSALTGINASIDELKDSIEADVVKYTEFEVFPTMLPILSGTIDSLDDLTSKGIIDSGATDQSIHIFTGLKYNVQVEP